MSEKYLWTKKNGHEVTVGLTKEAIDELGNISFAQLPAVGTKVEAKKSIIEIEAEKAIVEYQSPISGTVISINEENLDTLEALDEADAWLFKVTE